MKTNSMTKNKDEKQKKKIIKKANNISFKIPKNPKIKPLTNNNKLLFNSPFNFEKINNRKKTNNILNNSKNKKEDNFSIKLHKNIHNVRKKNSIKENNNKTIFSEKEYKKDINQKKIKHNTINITNKKGNKEILDEDIQQNQNTNFFKSIKIVQNINHPKVDIYKEYNNFKTKYSINKSRTRGLFTKYNLNNLNSTDYSSSITKNTFLINKINTTKDNSLSNHNKTVLSDISKINKIKNNSLNRKNDINKVFKLKVIKNKNCYNSTRNFIKDNINFKENLYKNLKKNNELIKEINTIRTNNNIINKKININSYKNKNKSINIQNYSSSINNYKLYQKLSYNSRKQCKLKQIFFKHIDYSLEKKPEQKTYININNKINENKEMNKIRILIKSNWGNSSKINFTKISFIDIYNEKIEIKNANYDIDKEYIEKYNKGETKILIFYFDIKNKIKNIEIINGFDDSGIKSIIIENEQKEIIWRGIIPKKTLISNKPYIIILNSITKHIKNQKSKNKNKSFDFEESFFSDKIVSPHKHYINKSNINNICINRNIFKIIKKINNINIKKKRINESNLINFRKETYDRDNSDFNIMKSKYLISNMSNIISSEKQIKCKLINTDYQICDKIKIKLLSNYGHSKNIGLSGIEFYNEVDNLIDIDTNVNLIKTNQKILKYRQKKILNNLFYYKNDTTDIKNMFLTKKDDAFIEIDFKQKLKIKKIIFYNYNNELYKNCCTKKLSLIFYINKQPEKTIKSIYLNKNICEEGIEYGQMIKYPFNKAYNIKKYNNMNNNIKHNLLNNILIYNKEYDYYSPSYPSGFIIKILLINNWGNNEYIGLEQIQLFDENNYEIKLFKDESNIASNINKNIKDIEDNIPEIHLLPENRIINGKINPMILTKNKNNENRIYIIFKNLIMLSKINIINYNKYDEIAVKNIKILIDDNLIFEGELNNKKINQIFFSNINDELISDNNDIIKERYSEKTLEDGTKILSLV